jgi:hypothetical protein
MAFEKEDVPPLFHDGALLDGRPGRDVPHDWTGTPEA